MPSVALYIANLWGVCESSSLVLGVGYSSVFLIVSSFEN